jgi:hypothetical protein
MKRRTWLLVPAILFLAWEVVASLRWFQAGASVGRTWQTALADPMTLLFLTDGLMFAGIVLLWMVTDLRKSGASAARCAGWVAAVVLLGSPAFLFYLSWHTSLASDQVPLEAS